MRNRTKLALALLIAGAPGTAFASAPSIATLDAGARASGNRKDVAMKIGDALFAIEWPAQVMKVSANETAGTLVIGLRVSGVKFHGSLTLAGFESEAMTLVQRVFSADPHVAEVDLWAAVPLTVGKGVIVSGDLATPTTRNVFTLSVVRNESEAALAERIKTGQGVYLDEEWARAVLKGGT